jgi:hypothetical protein
MNQWGILLLAVVDLFNAVHASNTPAPTPSADSIMLQIHSSSAGGFIFSMTGAVLSLVATCSMIYFHVANPNALKQVRPRMLLVRLQLAIMQQYSVDFIVIIITLQVLIILDAFSAFTFAIGDGIGMHLKSVGVKHYQIMTGDRTLVSVYLIISTAVSKFFLVVSQPLPANRHRPLCVHG